MKNNLLSILVISLIFVSCQSKEEKAAKLIKEDMFKTLYDFSSYQPIETKIDSAFTTIYHDSTILGYAYQAIGYLDNANECLEKAKEAQSSMEIWSDSYSSLGELKYKNAKDEFTSNLGSAREYMLKIKGLQSSIRNRVSKFKPSFCGWQAKHKFRCKTKGGNSDLANYIYVFDPKLKKIIYSENTEDEKLEKIRNIIDETLKNNSTSNE